MTTLYNLQTIANIINLVVKSVVLVKKLQEKGEKQCQI